MPCVNDLTAGHGDVANLPPAPLVAVAPGFLRGDEARALVREIPVAVAVRVQHVNRPALARPVFSPPGRRPAGNTSEWTCRPAPWRGCGRSGSGRRPPRVRSQRPPR